jgi:putative ABC transport system permease protein
MDDLLRDVRFAVRMLIKNPGVTAAAVLALGLGIGLTTTTFSIAYGALMRGLPFERSERIMHLEANNPSQHEDSLEVWQLEFLDWRERQTSFEGLASFYSGTVNLSGDSQPERYDGAFITANAFSVLRVKPLLGRALQPADEAPQAEPAVVLGHNLWRSRYGGDPKVIGRPVRVNGRPGTIVGVMPPGFAFPIAQEVWVPLQIDRAKLEGRDDGTTLEVFGRLKDGVTPEQARAQMSGVAKALAREYPDLHRGRGITVKPYTEEYLGPEVFSMLSVMVLFGLVVLLIACANVASLMVARATRRTREIAIRSAMGAGRRRVVTQLLVESLMLSAAGALLGIGLAFVGVQLFNGAIYGPGGNTPPFWIRIAVDAPALLFTLGVTLLAGLTSGLMPALQASRTDVSSVLKDEGRGSTSLRLGWLSRAIVVSELAVCCMLLVGAGLMVKSILKLRTADFHFDSGNLLTVRIALFQASYPEPAVRAKFFDDLVRRLEARGGVESVAVASSLPVTGSGRDYFRIEGKAYPDERELPSAWTADVSPGFFRTLRARLVAGRDFGAQDGAGGAPVLIVNQSFAQKAWPNGDPLGRRVRLGRKPDSPWRTVVGVVPDLKWEGLESDEGGTAGVYLPLAQETPNFATAIVRTRGEPLAMAPVVRQDVLALDRDLPIYFVRSMDEVVANSAFFFNLFGTVFSVLGACALVLASVGIYGVIAFAVGQRTQEIGVRMALGAHRGNVLAMILRQGTVQLAVGLGAGLALAFAVCRMMRFLLYQVEPTDPPTYGLVSVVLCLVAFLASAIPARRAARVDPLVAIRSV